MEHLEIDIFSDPICPWCMIGKRRLDRAIDELRKEVPEFAPRLRWRVFQLNPTMPEHGMDRSAYLAAKFGGADRAGEIYRTIAKEGSVEGISFKFDRIGRTPNTLKAHALIRLAADQGQASAMAERLFAAYFLEGLDIGKIEVLKELADDVGLSGASQERLINDESVITKLRAEDAAARARKINGVPYFVINGRYSLSGAVAPKVLIRAIELTSQGTT